MFGDFISDLRRTQGITLRQFCAKTNLDTEYWGEVERNVEPPPDDKAVLMVIGKTLGLTQESDVWPKFVSLAALGSKQGRSTSEADVAAKLPLFCRKKSDEKPTESDLRAIADLFKNG